MNSHSLTEMALAIWEAGLDAVDASKIVRQHVELRQDELLDDPILRIGSRNFPCSEIRNLYVLGGGKAAGWMAAGIEAAIRPLDSLFQRLSGIVNVAVPGGEDLRKIRAVPCRPEGINLPTEQVITSTQEMLTLLQTTTKDDLCLFVITGGASALLEVPASPISLADLCELTEILTKSGTPIEELNLVRSHLSRVKRGGLANAAFPAKSVGLILSDVVGNRLESIGSGPTVVSESKPDEVREILRARIPNATDIPHSILDRLDFLSTNANSLALPGNPTSSPNSNLITGSLETAVDACAAAARRLGFETNSTILTNEGDASTTAKLLVGHWHRLQDMPSPQCLIIGGEPTVTISGNSGTGGRNTHLVLDALLQLTTENRPGSRPAAACLDSFCLASLSTDGEDGNAPASGAVLDGQLIDRVRSQNQIETAQNSLTGFDSYHFLSRFDAIVPSRTTRTNVGDLRILLTGNPSQPTPPLN